MKLRRPYIPLAVRVAVAERQIRKNGLEPAGRENFKTLKQYLASCIYAIFRNQKVELHHRPAIVNRPFNMKTIDWDPPANDPDYLVYLPEGDHDIETRVRGLGAQRSDLAQRRYNKRVARNRMVKDKKRPSRWPKRKLRSKPINSRWRRKRFG